MIWAARHFLSSPVSNRPMAAKPDPWPEQPVDPVITARWVSSRSPAGALHALPNRLRHGRTAPHRNRRPRRADGAGVRRAMVRPLPRGPAGHRGCAGHAAAGAASQGRGWPGPSIGPKLPGQAVADAGVPARRGRIRTGRAAHRWRTTAAGARRDRRRRGRTAATNGMSATVPRRALLVIDVINPLDFPGGKQLLVQALPAVRNIARLKRRLKARDTPIIYVNDNFTHWLSDFREL